MQNVGFAALFDVLSTKPVLNKVTEIFCFVYFLVLFVFLLYVLCLRCDYFKIVNDVNFLNLILINLLTVHATILI